MASSKTRSEADMSQTLQHPFVVTMIQPRRVCATSWWIDCPRERFTEQCKAHVCQEPPRERVMRKAAGVAAELEMTG
jgi:hypothetical protein